MELKSPDLDKSTRKDYLTESLKDYMLISDIVKGLESDINDSNLKTIPNPVPESNDEP